jgi:hypothetical protein
MPDWQRACWAPRQVNPVPSGAPGMHNWHSVSLPGSPYMLPAHSAYFPQLSGFFPLLPSIVPVCCLSSTMLVCRPIRHNMRSLFFPLRAGNHSCQDPETLGQQPSFTSWDWAPRIHEATLAACVQLRNCSTMCVVTLCIVQRCVHIGGQSHAREEAPDAITSRGTQVA